MATAASGGLVALPTGLADPGAAGASARQRLGLGAEKACGVRRPARLDTEPTPETTQPTGRHAGCPFGSLRTAGHLGGRRHVTAWIFRTYSPATVAAHGQRPRPGRFYPG